MPRPSARHPRAVVAGAAAAAMLVLLAACGGDSALERRSNVKPPRPGTPSEPGEVTGIYRSIHQGVLQLREDGSYVLIVPEGPGATSGRYTLNEGVLQVRSEQCGEQSGTYDVVVTGEQEAGKAILRITPVDDACAERRHYLTVDPWVYADS